VRWVHRLAVSLGVVAPSLALVIASCSTGTVGVAACQAIQSEICSLAPACGIIQSSEVEDCQIYYRDFCLVGIENTDAGNADPAPCVGALEALVRCKGNEPGADCPGAPILDASWVPSAACGPLDGGPYSACHILQFCPELLAACSFVAYPPSAPDGSTTAVAEASATTGPDAASD
jgi:hypothetical protein